MGWVQASGSPKGFIDVTREGVRADGVTNDQPALQALIDDRNVQRKYSLLLPSDRTIQLGAALTLKSDIAILGGNYAKGFGYTALRPSGDFPALQIVASTPATRIYVGHLQILCNNMAGGSRYAIELNEAYIVDFDRIYITATDASKTFRGIKMDGAVDSVRFYALELMECRGQHLEILAATDCAFYGSNFESDVGLATIDSRISGKWVRSLSFDNCQFERVGGLIVDAKDVVFTACQRTQTSFVFSRWSRNCRIDAGGGQSSSVLYDYGVDNQINGSSQNSHGVQAWSVLRGSVGDGFVSSTKTAQRSVYGAGREYLFLVDAQASTVAPGSSTVTFTAQPSATNLETSPTFSLEDIGGGSETTDRKDAAAYWSCLAVPAGDTEIAITASSNVIPVWHAWPNLLQNGVLSDDSSGDPPTGWTKTGTFTPSYSGGWMDFTSAGSNVSISQTLPITAGEYLFMARVRGDCALAVGSVTNGTDGARQALTFAPTAGRTDVFGTNDHLLMCRFKGNSSLTVSIGKLGTPSSTIGVRWAAVVRVDEEQKLYATAPPTWSSRYWPQGTVIWNAAPSGSNPAAWVCVTAGSPGTWKALNLAA